MLNFSGIVYTSKVLACIWGTLAALHRASTAAAEIRSVGPNIAITPLPNSSHAGNKTN